jgi:hypothetical protein
MRCFDSHQLADWLLTPLRIALRDAERLLHAELDTARLAEENQLLAETTLPLLTTGSEVEACGTSTSQTEEQVSVTPWHHRREQTFRAQPSGQSNHATQASALQPLIPSCPRAETLQASPQGSVSRLDAGSSPTCDHRCQVDASANAEPPRVDEPASDRLVTVHGVPWHEMQTVVSPGASAAVIDRRSLASPHGSSPRAAMSPPQRDCAGVKAPVILQTVTASATPSRAAAVQTDPSPSLPASQFVGKLANLPLRVNYATDQAPAHARQPAASSRPLLDPETQRLTAALDEPLTRAHERTRTQLETLEPLPGSVRNVFNVHVALGDNRQEIDPLELQQALTDALYASARRHGLEI